MLTFRPDQPPHGTDKELGNWLSRQFESVRKAANTAAEYLYLATTNNPPSRTKDGEYRLADGSNWDPGFGFGTYFWSDTNNRWIRLFCVESGGTVTQATDKTTAVTLNTRSGEITMNNAALAATTGVTFTMNNTLCKNTSVIQINHVSGGTLGNYHVQGRCTSGSASINVYNRTAGSLSDAVKLRFTILPGATS